MIVGAFSFTCLMVDALIFPRLWFEKNVSTCCPDTLTKARGGGVILLARPWCLIKAREDS